MNKTTGKNNPKSAVPGTPLCMEEHRDRIIAAIRDHRPEQMPAGDLPPQLAERLHRSLGALRAQARLQWPDFLTAHAEMLERVPSSALELYIRPDMLARLFALWQADRTFLFRLGEFAVALPWPMELYAFWQWMVDDRGAMEVFQRRLADLRAMPDAEAFTEAVRHVCTPVAFQHLLLDGRLQTLYTIWCRTPKLFAGRRGRVGLEHLTVEKTPALALVQRLAGGMVLPKAFRKKFAHLSDQEVDWCCHLLGGGDLSTLPALTFGVSPSAVALFCDEERSVPAVPIQQFLFSAVLAAEGVPWPLAHRGAEGIGMRSKRAIPLWVRCLQVLGRMEAGVELVALLEQLNWPLGRMTQFLETLERCCAPEVFQGLFREGHHGWMFGIWKAVPALFDGVRDQRVVAGGWGSTYAIIEALMGRRVLPEPFLFRLRHAAHQTGVPLLAAETAWMVHMLRGGSIKDAPELPFPLSRRTAHVFNTVCSAHGKAGDIYSNGVDMRVPGSVRDLLFFAEFIACGASDRFAQLATAQVRHWPKEGWVVACRALIGLEHEGLGLREILDYVRWMEEQGTKVDIGSMTLQSLNRRIQEWHQDIEWMEVEVLTPRFKSRGIPVFSRNVEGVDYRIAQVETPKDLGMEGRILKHCVGSYGNRCAAGQVAIFSLRSYPDGEEKRLITIELAFGAVVQAKGFANRDPNELEWALLREWVDLNPQRIPRDINLYNENFQ
jgi:hypothetical protein